MYNRLKYKLYTLLRWSEKYAQTDMVYVTKNGFWVASGTVSSAILSFITAVSFANLVPQTTYGTYQYILSTLSICAIFTLKGMNTATTQSVAKNFYNSIQRGLKQKILWGVLGSIMSFSIGIYYIINGNATLGYGFLIGGLFLPFWETFGMFSSYLQGKKEFKNFALYNVFAHATVVLFLVVTLFSTDNVLIILGVYLGTWTLSRLFFLYKLFQKYPIQSKSDPDLIPYGKHLSFMTILNVISGSTDKILLWHFLGPLQVATYTIASTLPNHVTNLIQTINRIAFPKMVTASEEDIQKNLPIKILRLSFIMVIVVILYLIAVPYIFNIIFPQYSDAIFITQILIIALIFQPVTLIASALTAQTKKRALYVHNTITPIIRIGLFTILIPTFFIVGAAWAFVLSRMIESLVLIYLFKRS